MSTLVTNLLNVNKAYKNKTIVRRKIDHLICTGFLTIIALQIETSIGKEVL